jgi:hypothetical protein
VLVLKTRDRAEPSVCSMNTPLRTHGRRLLAGALAIAATAAVATPAHAGQTKTLRFFEKTTDVRLTAADGTPKDLSAGPPAAGDILDASGVLYRGDHLRHGDRVIGTDHTRCVFTTPDSGSCQGEVAIGNSLILVRSALSDDAFTVWYGTGAFRGITGGGTTRNLGDTNNSDVVLRYRLG